MIKTNATKKQAILYTRVSTEEQATRGGSLKTQKDVLRQYCQLQNIEIIKIFVEDHSAKTFNRPEWRKLMLEIENSKTRPDLVLFTRWDRFSRNTGDAYYVIKQLTTLGVEPQAIEQPLNLCIPENKMMFAFYLAIPEVENARRGLNTKIGMQKAREKGRCLGVVPIGYKGHCLEDGTKIIIPKEPEASIIRLAFHQLANLKCNIADAYKFTLKEGMKGCRSNFWQLLQNPIYTGCIKITDIQSGSSYTVLGLHKPIVSTPTFNMVQELFFRREKNTEPSNKNISISKFLLKGFISCPKCGKALTASASSGRRSKYFYYHCKTMCKHRRRAEAMYDRFILKLKELKPLPEYFDRFKTQIRLNYENQNKSLNVKRIREIQSIELFTDRIHKAKNLLLDGHFEFEDYKNIKYDLEAKIKLIGYSIEANSKKQIALSDKIEEASKLFTDLDKFITALEIKNRRAFLSAILEPNHNWESQNDGLIFKRSFRIAYGLERPVIICEKTAEEITVLVKALADIELLINY